MLMEDRQIAVNDVIVACVEAADHYRDGADFFEDPNLTALFSALADEREAMADELGAHVRDLGALPRKPDADLELFHRLASRFKAAVSPSERAAVIEERINAEKHVGSLIAIALGHELPDSTVHYLKTSQQRVHAAQRRLAALKSAL